MSVFVDDVERTFVQDTTETQGMLVARAVGSSLGLESALTEGSYEMNLEKAKMLMGTRGSGAHASIRAVRKGTWKKYGEPVRYARYLGPQLGMDCLLHVEVAARISQAKKKTGQ